MTLWWFPESQAGAASGSTVVIHEMANDSRIFAYYNLQRNVSAEDMLLSGNVASFVAFRSGYIRSTSAEFSDTLTAGEVSIVLVRNGAVIANTSLNLTINLITQPRHHRSVPQDADFAFAAGDRLGFRLSSDGILTPVDREVSAAMWIEYT